MASAGVENVNDGQSKDETSNNSERVGENNTPTYRTANEYCTAVNQWLWQCYYSQCFTASLPFFLSALSQQGAQSTDVNRNITSGPFFPNNRLGHQFPFAQPSLRVQLITDRGQRGQGREYLLPPLWKRISAEVIDFFILLILKLLVTYVAVDFFEIIDLDKYDLDILKDDKVDYRVALEMTSEILTLEIIHRFVVCLFEAICLHRGTAGPGGATPGKSFMKLRVVKCLEVVQMSQNPSVVRILPADDIGFGWALVRSFIKNFSMAFFFPACCTIFFFQHNRAAYDMICKCIVVEEIPRIRGRQ